MKIIAWFWAACAFAAVWPRVAATAFPRGTEPRAEGAEAFPGWPEMFEGVPLAPSARGEAAGLAANFPGRTGVFAQDGRVVILRWIRRPTRGVHPAADCFRARGYRVTARGLVRDGAGAVWAEFRAERGEDCWSVREQWRDAGTGRWTDVSAWYWAAQAAGARGPWWGIVVAERV